MKKILIDVDEVICHNEYLSEMNKFAGTNYKIDDFTEYFIDSVLGSEEKIKEFNEKVSDINLYNNPEIIEGAVEAIEELSKKYEVYILSACINPFAVDKSGRVFADKYNFIRKNFPFIKPDNIIFTGSKNIFKADIQIDDSFKHLKNDTPIKLLFTAYHNKTLDKELTENNIVRVNGWKDVLKILM